MVREQWDQLVVAYPTVKDPPTSYHSSHFESGENEDDLDVESRVESIMARYEEVEGALAEMPEEVEKATADLQAFVDGDYITVYRWVEEGLERTTKEAESKHCIGVTQNVLDEHIEFEKDVAEQREKLPSLQEDAEELWEEYAPGQWLKDKMAALEDMFDQLDQLCASRKGYLEDLLDKWNEFEGAFKSLTDWIMDEAQHFSNLCTNKKEYGVVEHLDACDALMEKLNEHTAVLGKVEDFAATL